MSGPVSTVSDTITNLERLNNTEGNPRWRVFLAGGGVHKTKASAAVGYKIDNSEYREGRVYVTFDSNGEIINVETVGKSA